MNRFFKFKKEEDESLQFLSTWGTFKHKINFFFTFFEIENYIWMQCQILPVSVQGQVDLKESKGDWLIQPWQQSKSNTGDFCLTSQATCVGH